MKTFKELSVGDTIYQIKKKGTFVSQKDQYENVYPANIITEQPVTSISKENDKVIINKNNGYGSYYLLSIKDSQLNQSIIDDGDNLWLINEDEKEQTLRNAVVDKIRFHEQEIVRQKKLHTEEIEKIRVAYYDLLNPRH